MWRCLRACGLKSKHVCCLFFWRSMIWTVSFCTNSQNLARKNYSYTPLLIGFLSSTPITFTPSHALLTPISLRLYWVPGRKHRNMSHVPSDKELTIWTGCPFHILYLLHSIFQALMLSLLWTWHTPYWVRAHSGNHFFLISSSKTYFVTDPRDLPYI